MAELVDAYTTVVAAPKKALKAQLHRRLLFRAIDKGHLHTVEWLSENSSTREKDYGSFDFHENPLLYACAEGNLSVVRHLMGCPHVCSLFDSFMLRMIPLIFTCLSIYRARVYGDEGRQRRILGLVRFLLLPPHAWNYDINAVTDGVYIQNATLLKIIICATKDLHILKLLLYLGADPTECDIPQLLNTGDASFMRVDPLHCLGMEIPAWSRGAYISPAMRYVLTCDARDWRVYRLMKARVICDVEHAVEKKAPLKLINVCLRERVRVFRAEAKGEEKNEGEGNNDEEEEGSKPLPLPSVNTTKREPQEGKEEGTETLDEQEIDVVTSWSLEEGAKKRQEDENIDAVVTHILHGGLKQELFIELCAMMRERDSIGKKGREYLSM